MNNSWFLFCLFTAVISSSEKIIGRGTTTANCPELFDVFPIEKGNRIQIMLVNREISRIYHLSRKKLPREVS